MSDAVKLEPSKWTKRWADWTTVSGIGSALVAAIGAYGTGFGLWHFVVGFLLLAAGLLLGISALISGPVALVKARKTTQRLAGVWIGMLCTLAFLGLTARWIVPGLGAPMIHDVTTDLGNPPAFQKLKLRADNLAGAGSIENWRALHAGAYSDLQPLTLRASQAEVRKVVEKLVRDRGWEIALLANDRIEATESVSPFRFKDDVVILIRPEPGGNGLILVDMRSVSRVGAGDLGVNARRVRDFMADLRASGPNREAAPETKS